MGVARAVLFNSLEYVAFLLGVFALYWACARRARVALGILLAASLVFYASWNAWFLLLIAGTTLVDFVVGHRLQGATEPAARRRLVWSSVVLDLGALATFKYFDFFLDSAAALVGPAFTDWRLDVALPVGISFFTFQSMSYTIDIYRGRLDSLTAGLLPLSAHRGSRGALDWLLALFASYRRFLLYVSFFPQLVAGPIVRARDFLPQLERPQPVTDAMGGRGLTLIGVGLFKKVIIADYLALNLVDRAFDAPDGFSSLEMLTAIYGYAFQIYGDFSGYSDIAIGSALLLGFTFPDNFAAPYTARDLQQFWRKWHISLSTWLRDYLYIALGGSRGARWKTYRNLLLTMLLGGLWHGAGWNFVIWGALHGGALAALRAVQRARGEDAPPLLGAGPVGRALAVLATFHYVCFAWIFFRCEGLPEVEAVLTSLLEGSTYANNLTAPLLGVLALAVATHFAPRGALERLIALFTRLPAPAQAAAMVGAGLGLKALASAEVQPFIYFQF
ncbi:MAG: MBOAT family protein [Myxococcales bacterium]|nr:MBOAT family protein [Myxococcales bacterium]MCB9524483.1 MBOAT family protein [Myxococcales bacterium]